MKQPPSPRRGDVWLLDFNPVRGREPAGLRPALILSVDKFNSGPAGLVVAVPMTTKHKPSPFNIPVRPPDGGLSRLSFVKCEDVRSVSKDRLVKRYGSLAAGTLANVEDMVRILLGL